MLIHQLFETTIQLRGFGGAPTDAVRAFFGEVNSQSMPNPLNDHELIFFGAGIQLRTVRNKEIYISDIRALQPGGGKAAMAKLCELADRFGVPMSLHAKGYASTPTSHLLKWYTGMGFVAEDGDDFDGYDMKRMPK